MPPTAAIEFSGVQKWFGNNHVLADIDLSIATGEVLVVVGPSGSGKSTLIRCINGLEAVQSGTVVVDGKQLTAKARVAGARRTPREGRRLSRAAFRRPAAARRDRARARDAAEGAALRRADQRARPRDDQRSARRDEGPRAHRDHDGRRDPRDGLRARGRRPHRLHGRRPHRRAGGARAVLLRAEQPARPAHEDDRLSRTSTTAPASRCW